MVLLLVQLLPTGSWDGVFRLLMLHVCSVGWVVDRTVADIHSKSSR